MILALGNTPGVYSQESELDSLFTSLNSIAEDTSKSIILYNISNILNRSYPDSAMEYSVQGLELAQKIHFQRGIGKNLTGIGVVYWTKGDYQLALEYYNKAIEVFSDIDDKLGVADCNSCKGIIYGIRGDYSKSLIYFQETLKYLEETGNKEGQSTCLTNIGILHKRQSNYKLALEYYQRSLEIDSALNNSYGMASNYINMGSIHTALKDYEAAKDLHRKALVIKKNFHDQIGQGLVYTNLAQIEFYQHNLDSAQKNYLLALKINRKSGSKKSITFDLNGLGELYRIKANLTENKKLSKVWLDSAAFYLLKSLDISKKLNILPAQVNSYRLLSHVYEDKNDYQRALVYQKTFVLKKDSLYNNAKMKEIESLEAKFQSDGKNLQISNLENAQKLADTQIRQQRLIIIISFISLITIILFVFFITLLYRQKVSNNKKLANQNEEILLQNNKIEKYLKELETSKKTQEQLYSVIAHDLKSPFNAMIGISDLLIENWVEMPEEEQLKMVKLMNKTATNSYGLLLNLLEWSLFQSGNLEIKPTIFSFNSVLDNTLILFTAQLELKNIRLEKQIEHDWKVFADQLLVPTILRNLVSNAIKFTPDGGNIKVVIQKEKDMLLCSVQDTGIGIDSNHLASIFKTASNKSTKGTAGETGTGLGLKICQEFVVKSGGKIVVSSKLGEGSSFSFTLPLSKTNE